MIIFNSNEQLCLVEIVFLLFESFIQSYDNTSINYVWICLFIWYYYVYYILICIQILFPIFHWKPYFIVYWVYHIGTYILIYFRLIILLYMHCDNVKCNVRWIFLFKVECQYNMTYSTFFYLGHTTPPIFVVICHYFFYNLISSLNDSKNL